MSVEGKVAIASGYEIAYKQIGDPDDPVVIFNNGSNFNYHQFDHVYLPKLRTALGDDYCYILYDYVGYGQSSDINGEDFDFLRISDQLIEFMDAMALDRAHLFGLSKGSMIAQLTTARYPDRVISFGGYGSPNVADKESQESIKPYYRQRLAELEQLKDHFELVITDETYDFVYDKIYIPTMFERSKEDLNIFQKMGSWFMKRKLKSMVLGFSIGTLYKLFQYYLKPLTEEEKSLYIDLMKSIKVPTLLMHGGSDPYVPISSSELLAEWIDPAELISFESYKHNIPTMVPWQGGNIMNTYSKFVIENAG